MRAPHGARRTYRDYPASKQFLSDHYAPDLTDHDKHVSAVLKVKPSGFPAFSFGKERSA